MKHVRWIVKSIVAGGMSLVTTQSFAQAKMTAVPDAQVESDVLKALARNPKLADQAITSTTVYGTVTLSGSVRDEDRRKLAETIASRTPGVQKVVDELTLSTDSRIAGANTSAPTQTQTQTAQSSDGSNPLLQSDGTMASPPTSTPQVSPQEPSRQPQDPYAQPQNPYRQPAGPYGQAQQPSGQSSQQRPPGAPAQQGPSPGRPYAQGPYAPPPAYPQSPYAGRAQYGPQEGGQMVTVPERAMLRVRTNQELDSRHTQPGTVFDAVVLNDVVADSLVAIPRGATVQGTVVESRSAGALKGRGELGLQLTHVILAGRVYPITSDIWSNAGGDKTARTVNSALGLGAVGAIIGGVAGGGAGAAIGAGVGGAAGVGASAASEGGQAYVPAEAILIFHLTQPVALATVSQVEVERLGYGVPAVAQMRRRYVRPAPYGYPVPYQRYPYPYAYPYPY